MFNTDKHTINWIVRRLNNVEKPTLSEGEKSRIIYSVIAGIPSPLCILEDDSSYQVLMGNDYLATILDFVHGGFYLSEIPQIDVGIKSQYNGKTFFDFSDDQKENFLESEIIVSLARSITPVQKALIFSLPTERAPEPLAEKQVISSPVDGILEKLLAHDFFNAINVSSPTIDLVVQCLMVKDGTANTDLKVKDILAFKESMTKADANIKKELDYLAKVYPEKASYLKKTHIPMIYAVACRALNSKVEPARLRTFLDGFYGDMDSDYRKACDSGTLSKSNSNKRLKILLESYDKEFAS